MKTTTIHARIQPDLKTQVEAVLNQLGISTSEAITLYFKQIHLQQGLPFEVKLPNAVTQKAMGEANAGKGKRFDSVAGLMDDLND
jgi:DNA-damage-inducible protein J